MHKDALNDCWQQVKDELRGRVKKAELEAYIMEMNMDSTEEICLFYSGYISGMNALVDAKYNEDVRQGLVDPY